MRIEEVREVVKITIEELLNENHLKDPYPEIKETVEHELRDFFNGGKSNRMGKVLNQLSDDKYIDLIFFHYRDGKTLEWLAGYYDKETRTISRNKKRLILEAYKLLQAI